MVKTLVRLFDPTDHTEIVFATNPAEITTQATSEDAAIRLDYFGTLARPMGRPPTTYSWSGMFYSGLRYANPFVDKVTWRPPEDIQYQLENWHDQQPRRTLPLELEVINGALRMLKPVYITNLGFRQNGAFGDLGYDLTLTEWRNIIVAEFVGEVPGEQVVDETSGQDPEVGEPPIPAEYTVKPGDSLWMIAEEQLGDGARYPEIYELNQEVIGDNVDYIQPGQVLLMPGGTGDVFEPAIPDVVDYLGYVESVEI